MSLRPNILAGLLGSSAPAYDYLADSGSMFPIYGDTHQSSMYFADTNTTWYSWQTTMGGGNYPVVRTLNHTTGAKAGPYIVAFDNPLANDDHGNPGIARTSQGHVIIFYGSHGSDQYYVVSTNPNDPSSWTPKTPIAGGVGGFTYPNCDKVGDDLYLFMRGGDSGAADSLSVLVATAPVGTAVTFGAATSLFEFGTGRCYQGTHLVRDSKIGVGFTQAAIDNSYRQDQFFAWVNVVAGVVVSVSNLAETVTVLAVSLPVGSLQLNNDFRLVNQGTSGHYGSIPILCDGINGTDIHFCYLDAPSINGQYTVKYRKWDGATLAVAEDVGTVPADGTYHKYDRFAPVALADGSLDVYYITAGVNTFDWGGDVSRRSRSAAGSWGSIALIQAAGTSYPLNGISVIKGPAHVNARVMWAECVASAAWLSAIESGLQKIYSYGAAGFVKDTIPIYERGWMPEDAVSATLIGFFDATDGQRVAYPPRDGVTGMMRLGNKVSPPQAYEQATANRQPVLSATAWDASTPGLTGDGAASNGDYMTSNDGPFATIQTVIMASLRGTQVADSGQHILIRTARSDGGATGAMDVVGTGLDAGQTQVRMTGNGSGGAASTATSFPVASKGIIYGLLKDNDMRCRANSGTLAAAGDIGATTATAGSLFGTSAGGSNYAGVIPMWLQYNGELSSDEAYKAEAWLAWRLGCQANLDAANPYKLVRP